MNRSLAGSCTMQQRSWTGSVDGCAATSLALHVQALLGLGHVC